jgi:hypothetical protein
MDSIQLAANAIQTAIDGEMHSQTPASAAIF